MAQPLKLQNYPVGRTFGFDDVADSVTALGFVKNPHPCVPIPTDGYVFRRDVLRELLGFLREPRGDAFFLSGPTGSGKTSGITETLARLYWPCQQITARGRLELSDLIGQYKLVRQASNGSPDMEFVHSVLPTAMRYGQVLLINELDYSDPSELSGLNDVIEGRPLVIPENGGEVIEPHAMFRVIATGNSSGGGDNSGLYRGVLAQNIAFMDRFRISKIGYMDADAEEQVLGHQVSIMPKKLRQKLIEVANAIRAQFLGESGTGADGNLSITMSTRTLIRWAKLAFDYRQHPSPLQYALELALTNRAEHPEKVAIEKIAAGILGDQWSPSA